MKEAGIFRMAVPRPYGGPQLDPMTQVRVVEELSRMDGSVGWCAMIGVSGGFLSAFADPAAVRQLFPDVDTVSAGQIAPLGRADLVEGGYRVSGRWGFASGCQHADVLFGSCVVFEQGQPRRLLLGLDPKDPFF
ncbi:MAG: acyl-CoA dehydrogenase family protein [Candidatus Binatia bacterium]